MIASLLSALRADLGSLVATVAAIVLMFAVAEVLRRARVHAELTRKFTHVFAGLWVVASPWLFAHAATVILLSLGFGGLMVSTRQLGLLRSVHGVERESWGPALFPLGVVGAVLLLWDRPVLFQAAVLILALGDALAALVGRRWGKRVYEVGSHSRTLEGSAAMFAVAFATTLALLGASHTLPWGQAALAALIVAAAVTAAEGVSSSGLDNVVVPVLAAALLGLYARSPSLLATHALFAVVVVAIGLVSLWRRNLTVSGALGAGLLGFVVLAAGGWPWFVALLAVFVGVNVTSRVGGGHKPAQAKGATRDHLQVFANVGVAGLLAVPAALHPDPMYLWGFLGALGFAGADTLASELGVLWGRAPVSITTLKPVAAGMSGGVSLPGYGAAVIGGLLAPLGFLLATAGRGAVGVVAASVLGGLVGCTVDSVIGDVFQVRLRCASCGAATETKSHCGVPARHVGGLRRIDNDAVNLVGSLSGAATGLLLYVAIARLGGIA